MVAAFDHCLFGRGGAAPSIDTAMHGLVDAAHVDHLHPDAGIAFATAADGEALTRQAFGDRVAWTPWRRPGFQLGLDIAAIRRERPDAIGVILGGHGITAWGASSEEAERNSLDIIGTAEQFIAEHGRPDPFGAVVPGHEPLPEPERRARAAALFPLLRGLASTDRPQVGHFTDSDVVLDFVAREEMPRLAELGTSCPDHFLRTKVRPLVVDLPGSAPFEELEARIRELHAAYRDEYAAYYERHADARLAADARCRPGDRPRSGRRHVQLRGGQADRPGRRRVLRQRDQRHARCRGNQHVRADPGIGEVPHRVLGARGGQAGPAAQAQAARDPRRVRDRRRLGDRTGHRPPARRRGRVRHRRRHRCGQCGGGRARDRHHRPRGQRCLRRHRRGADRRRPRGVAARLRRRRHRRQQRRSVDLEVAVRDGRPRLGPPARRHGAGLVPRLARVRPGDARPGHGRRPRVHRQQERLLRGAEQRRLRRLEGGPGAPGPAPCRGARPVRHPRQRRSTRTASCAAPGSSPRAGARIARGPTASRRTSSASSTRSARCSRRRSCRSTSPRRSSRWSGATSSQTTGLHVPVDAGVAAAFLR